MLNLSPIAGWVLSFFKDRKTRDREATAALARELETLADMMDAILEVTSADGRIDQRKLPELQYLCSRVWKSWATIIETRGYGSRDPNLKAAIDECITVVHFAPGSLVDEIELARTGVRQGYISPKARQRLGTSIDGLRNLVTRTRLDS